jgi:hypothetical protein
VKSETRSGSDFESVYEGPKDGDVTSSIAVVRVEAPEGVSLEEITRSGQRNVRRAFGNAASTGPPVEETLGGEEALRLDYLADESRVRQIGAMRAGHFYLVSFTAARSSFELRLEDFEAMLRSWRWD